MKAIYTIVNVVIRGKGRGKLMGFPTANMKLEKGFEIPEGIYVAKVLINKKEYLAATFIGSAKTFSETEKLAESYILNFNEEIYGKEIRINLFKKIRDNIKFSSSEELVLQIRRDVLAVSEFFRFGL